MKRYKITSDYVGIEKGGLIRDVDGLKSLYDNELDEMIVNNEGELEQISKIYKEKHLLKNNEFSIDYIIQELNNLDYIIEEINYLENNKLKFEEMYKLMTDNSFNDFTILLKLKDALNGITFFVDTEHGNTVRLENIEIISDNITSIDIENGHIDTVENIIKAIKEHIIYNVKNVEDINELSLSLDLFSELINDLCNDLSEGDLKKDTLIKLEYAEMGAYVYEVVPELEIKPEIEYKIKDYENETEEGLRAFLKFHYEGEIHNLEYEMKEVEDYDLKTVIEKLKDFGVEVEGVVKNEE